MLACMLFFSIPARRRSCQTTFRMLALFVPLTGVVGCGGGGTEVVTPVNPGNPAGNYTVTVIATQVSATATGNHLHRSSHHMEVVRLRSKSPTGYHLV